MEEERKLLETIKTRMNQFRWKKFFFLEASQKVPTFPSTFTGNESDDEHDDERKEKP